MINIDNVSFSYDDKKILNNFSLKIESGSHICLFGESGCGKTTLLRLITGLEKAESGSITSDEIRPAVVFQENRLLPFYTLKENISVVGGNIEIAEKYFNKLGMPDSMTLYPKKLSGGMKRRAAIIRALCVNYDYLVLDEPFNGLDEENTITAAALINEVSAGRTVIIVTHSLKEAELLNAQIVNM